MMVELLLYLRNKRETSSYVEISESVGVDSPSEILFITDVCQEAKAAKAAGNESTLRYSLFIYVRKTNKIHSCYNRTAFD